MRFTPEERLKDMDEQDTEVQVVSINTQILGYHLEASACVAQARQVNDEIASSTRQRQIYYAASP